MHDEYSRDVSVGVNYSDGMWVWMRLVDYRRLWIDEWKWEERRPGLMVVNGNGMRRVESLRDGGWVTSYLLLSIMECASPLLSCTFYHLWW